jgi:spermidine synthase
LIPWVQVDSTRTPDGGQELRLKRRGDEFSIMLGSNELMNSRLSGSEEALARLSCERIAGRKQPRMLIGGLGMGFTLRAALAALDRDATITIAELVPSVVAWARGPMSSIFDGCLDDPRVTVREADVGQLIKAEKASWDAILLDVDNGPEGIVYKGNDTLYAAAGLAAARAALKPGGVLAVWSQGPDSSFTRRLKQVGFAVEEINTRANGKRGARHVIWVATNGR